MDFKKPPLFPHQEKGIEYLQGEGGKAIFDEPGLGKTRQVIEALNIDMKTGLIAGALIVCPNSVKTTWECEIKKYSSYKPVVFENGHTGRRQAYLNLRPSYYVINYEAVILEKENLKRLLEFRPLALVLDESQRIKSPDAKVTKVILELRDLSTKRIIMTGTPVANKPEDLWSQILFLDGGELLGNSFSQFKTRFSTNSDSSLSTLKELISEVGLRRRKEDVLTGLPEKHFIEEWVDLTGSQYIMYHRLREELALWVRNMDGQEVLKNAEHILTRMLRLAQIASNPRLLDASYSEIPAKFQVLDSLIEGLLDTEASQKILVWSSFVKNIDELTDRYKKYGVVAIHGGIANEDREEGLKQFHSNDEVRLLIANPAAAREGLTLTEANVAIYLDRSFNLVDYLQSQDRIHRISQTKACYILNILARNTIDEFISYILEIKQQTAQFLQKDSLDLPPMDADQTKAELLQALI